MSMRALLWAGRSLSTSATNFQWSTHEHESTSVVLARRWGLPSGRCHARCAFHAGRAFLFFCKEGSASMRRSELRDFPDARPRPGALAPKKNLGPEEPSGSSPLRAAPFKWARRTWETRRPKELSKGKRPRSCERGRPCEACASRSLLVGSFERLLSPAMRARWDGGPFACWYTSASPA